MSSAQSHMGLCRYRPAAEKTGSTSLSAQNLLEAWRSFLCSRPEPAQSHVCQAQKTLDEQQLQGFVLLSTTDAQAKLTSEQNAISPSSGTYSHFDPATKSELICDKCPAGTYVSKHCTNTTLRECSGCPAGTFTKHKNGIERCHPCRRPCKRLMVERTPCTAWTDRECSCPPGRFLANDTCNLYSECSVGWGLKKKGTDTEDVRCKPCPPGTFSDVPSSVLRCRAFTDCSKKGMVVTKPGTREADNICGLPPSLLNAAGLSSHPEEEKECHKATTSLPKAK